MPGTDRPPRPGRDPGGRVAYLPPRAARARKLILRSQLGRGWIVASALFGLVILAAGVLFLTRDAHPGPPWVRVAALSSLPAGTVTEVAGPAGQVVVVDRRSGELRAFLAPPGSCPVRGVAGGGFARPCDGRRWDAEGGAVSELRDGQEAQPPLRRVAAAFAGGDLYVNPGGTP
jgi:nitrite reductase/ring-hydroxylating ferredoxin subunit